MDLLHERAALAYKEMQKHMPLFTSVARALTRNPQMEVRLGGRTEAGLDLQGREFISIRVPIEMADERTHHRCKETDANGEYLCEACRTEVGVFTSLIHEIAHHVFESFAHEQDEKMRRRMIMDAVRALAKDARPGSREAKLLDRVQSSTTTNLVQLSTEVSPFLPKIINALEDARVNDAMMTARPGTRKMFTAQIQRVFRNGQQRVDGSFFHWREADSNAQALILTMCKAMKLDPNGWFREDIIEDLDDDILNSLCQQAQKLPSIHDVFNMSIPVLERLRDLGYLIDDQDPEDDPPPEQGEGEPDESDEQSDQEDTQSDESESSEGDDESSDSDDQEGDADGSGEDDDDGDAEGDQDPEQPGDTGDGDEESDDEQSSGSGDQSSEDGDDEQGDSQSPDDDGEQDSDGSPDPEEDGNDGTSPKGEGSPDAVEEAYNQFAQHTPTGDVETNSDPRFEDAVEEISEQMEYFDAPSLTVSGMDVLRYDPLAPQGAWATGRSNLTEYYRKLVDPDPMLMSRLTREGRLVFTVNKKQAVTRHLKRGRRLDRDIGRLIPTDDPRLFTNRSRPNKRSYFVLIGGDVSGSTHGKEWNKMPIIHPIKQAVMGSAELCNLLGIPFAVYAHSGTGDPRSKGGARGLIHEVKADREPWSEATREALRNLYSIGYNLDGHTLEYYRKVIQRRRETDLILLYFTDGAMPASNYNEELAVLQREIAILRRIGVHLIGVGIGTDSPTRHGLDTIQINSVEEVPLVLEELRARLN